jgi:hypothetical protein
MMFRKRRGTHWPSGGSDRETVCSAFRSRDVKRGMLVVVVSLCGCVSTSTTNTERLDELRRRAAFDLHCDPAALKFASLRDVDGVVMQYGVEGCGQRSTYVHTWSGWVLNVAEGESAKK